jgi:hypothetical protein
MSSWWLTWHTGIWLAHRSAQLGMNFFRRNTKWHTKHKMAQKRGSNLRQHGPWKPLPLGYRFGFVVVWVIISLYYIQSAWKQESNLGWGLQFLSYWFYSKYCLNSNSNLSLNWNSNSSLSLNSNFSECIVNLAWIQTQA